MNLELSHAEARVVQLALLEYRRLRASQADWLESAASVHGAADVAYRLESARADVALAETLTARVRKVAHAAPPVDSTRRSPDGWIGHRGPYGRNVRWTHPELPGVVIRHCGHPTALRPYWIDGQLNELGTFRRLADAKSAAAAHASRQIEGVSGG